MNTISGESDIVFDDCLINSISFDEVADDLDDNKVENKDSNRGSVDAYNNIANVTGGTSKSDNNKDENCATNISSVAAYNTNAHVTGGSSKGNNHGGYRVGNKKGGPARNGEAERRRRGKLNKCLFELRSVVPKISKMDHISILRDAIDYLKELRQKVSTLERELELPPAADPPVATGLSQLTPTADTIPSCSTKDLVPIRKPIRVDVQKIGKGVLEIHIFCSPKPDLLYLISKTLNDLGLTIRDAMISCFDDFKLDFYAQQCNEGQYVNPDQIKVILLNLVGDHGALEV